MNHWRGRAVRAITIDFFAAASAAVLISGATPRAIASQALDPARKITQYRLRVWTDEEGLPQNSVQAVIQLRDGTMLVGTQDGLALFDGSKLASPEWGALATFGQVWVNRLLQDPDGSIWIATRGSGLIRVRNDRVTRFGAAQGLADESVESIHRDAAGTLWLGTADAGLFRMEGERAVAVPLGGVRGAEFIQAIASHRGRLLVGTRAGLFVGTPGNWIRYGRNEGLPDNHVYALAAHAGDTVWIGTATGGLLVLSGGRIAPMRGWRPISESVFAIRRGNRALWIGTNGGGLFRLYRGQIAALTTANGFPSNLVWSLGADHEGGLWAGTTGGGLVRIDDPSVTVLGAPEGLSSDIALATLQGRDGTVWIGTAGGGLNAVTDGRVRHYTTVDGLATNIVTALHEDASGNLWIGTGPRGLHVMRRGAISRVDLGGAFPGAGINTIRVDRQGRLWVGSNGAGLGIRHQGRWRFLQAPDSLPNNFVQAMAEDSSGRMYIATRAGVVAAQNGRLVRLPVFADAGRNMVIALHASPSGSLWMATNSAGLGRFRAGRLSFISEDRGLPKHGVNGIIEDAAGTLWLTTNAGVYGVSRAELEEVADGRRRRVESFSVGAAEGMRSRETNGGVDPPGWLGNSGEVLVPTMRGVVSIDARRLATARQPLVSITGAVVGDSLIPATGQVRLPSGTQRVGIAFRVLSFERPEALVVQYRLEGVDPGWIDAGSSRVATYTRLPPRPQTLEVRARHRLGAWSRPSTLRFQREPHWWERPAVHALLFVLLAALLLSAHRLRLAYWKREAGRHKLSAAESEAVLEAVRERETRFGALLEHASDAIFLLDAGGRISYVTRSMERVTGLSSEQLLNNVLVNLVHPEDTAEVTAALELIANSPGRPVPFRYRMELPGVGWRMFSAIGRNLLDEGIVAGIIVNARDVTEQEEAESLFRQAQRVDAIGNLAGGIAHDFNNLLAVIGANVSMLKDDLTELDVHVEGLDEITNATAGGQRLTSQLLSFSRQQVTHPAVVDLNAIVRDTAPMLRALMGSDVHLVVETGAGPAPVYIDRSEVEQVIVNLVVNAKSAMSRGGTVTVRVYRESAVNDGVANPQKGSYVVLSVRDTGSGMDAATRSRIFDPFFTTKATGTGLGLATVSWIAKKAHGFVKVESDEGQGSVFMVHLPIVEAAPGAAPARRDARLADTIVLVVDDDEPIRVLAARVLRGAGADVLTAGSAEAALAIGRSHRGNIDVLLTDLVMPGMSGRELAERFVELRPVSVLYMSGYNDAEISRTRAEGKDVGFLAKPFKPDELVAAVEAACRGDTAPAGA